MNVIKIAFLLALACITTPSLIHAQSTLSSLDTLLVSEINIPIQINLKPIYALAEKKVDTAFTSPNWPNDWIQSDCSTRYKYHFKRSPLRLTANGNLFNLSFTGFYKIIGSTRVCVGTTTLSPWTPACRCGFDEGDRKVNIGFVSSFVLQPNHILNIRTIRTEPQPLNKCTVCFWGQDITTQVMTGLKAELDAAKKAIDDSFSVVNLKPYMQQAWNKLNDIYAIAGLGFLTLHPKAVHMENISAKNDLLHINIGISATPLVSFERPDNPPTVVPNLSPVNNKNGFNIYLDALLNYDSLSHVVNQYMQNKQFDFSEGIFKKHVTINNCKISGAGEGNLLVQVQFSGSFNGTANFIGKPSYNSKEKTIEVQDLDYEVQTKSFLLNTAKWLFNKRILNELKTYTKFNLSNYYDSAATTLNAWLNKEWMKGIQSAGKVTELQLVGIKAENDHLLIRSHCNGNLTLLINELDFTVAK